MCLVSLGFFLNYSNSRLIWSQIAIRPIKTQRTVAQLLRDQQDQSLKAHAEKTASAAKEVEGHFIREGLDATLIPLPHVSEFTGMHSLYCLYQGYEANSSALQDSLFSQRLHQYTIISLRIDNLSFHPTARKSLVA